MSPRTPNSVRATLLQAAAAAALACGLFNPAFAQAPLKIGFIGTLSGPGGDRKSTRLNSSHVKISYAVFCLKKKKEIYIKATTRTTNTTRLTEQRTTLTV